MRIIWIIDNKYRDLYGLYDLKKELLNHKIKLYLFNIPVWKTAVDLINPNIIVIPNLGRSSCAPIVDYASKKKSMFFCTPVKGCFMQMKFKRINIQKIW